MPLPLPPIAPELPASAEIYLSLNGVTGQQWIRLDSFSLEMVNSGTTHISGGGGAGKVNFGDLVMTTSAAALDPSLRELLSTGAHLASGQIEIWSADRETFLGEYVLEDIVLTSHELIPDAAGGSDVRFSMMGESIAWFAADPNDPGGAGQSAGWNIAQTDTAQTPGTPDVPEIVEVVPELPETVQYYLELPTVAAGEWFAIENVSLEITNTASFLLGGGLTAGRAKYGDIAFDLVESDEAAVLRGYTATGMHLVSAQVLAVSADGVVLDSYALSDVLVTRAAFMASAGSQSYTSFELNFGQISETTRDSSATVIDSYSFDIAGDTAASEPLSAGAPALRPPAPGPLPPIAPELPASAEIYLSLNGVTGQQWIRLDSFSLEMVNSGTTHISGGGGAGKVNFGDLVMTTSAAALDPSLRELLSTGAHLASGQIEIWSADRETFLGEYVLEDIVLTSHELIPDAAGGSDVRFSMMGESIAWFAADPNDPGGAGQSAGWNIAQTDTAQTPGTPDVPEIVEVVPELPETVQYYLELPTVAAGEWFAIENVSLEITNTASFLLGGGLTAGRAKYGDIAFDLVESDEAAVLRGYTATGMHLVSAQVLAVSADGVVLDSYALSDVLVTRAAFMASAGSQSYTSFELNFGQISETTRDSSATVIDSYSFDIAGDTAASEPLSAGAPALRPPAPGPLPPIAPELPASAEIYLSLNGVTGQQWIRLDSFSLEMVNSGTTHISGGGGAGKVNFGDLVMTTSAAALDPSLRELLSTGAHLASGQIEIWSADRETFLGEYVLEDIVLTSHELIPDAAGGSDVRFSMMGESIAWFAADPNDPGGAGQSAGWNIAQTDTAQTPGTPDVPEIVEVVPELPETVQYYLELPTVAAGEWFAIENVSLEITNTASFLLGGGLTAGRAKYGDIAFDLVESDEAAVLRGYTATGMHLVSAQVLAVSADGVVLDSYALSDVLVTRAAFMASAGSQSYTSFELNFGQISETTRDSSATVIDSYSFDIAGDTAASSDLNLAIPPEGVDILPSRFLIGDYQGNIVHGDLGQDLLIGQSGADFLSGLDGADVLNGGEDNDTLTGGAGNDTLNGDAGDDLLEGGAGADELNGGADIDTASYAGSNAGITVSLFNNTASGGHAAGDSFVSIENVIGSDFDDVISGDAQVNVFEGGAGADQMFGGFSADTASYASSNAGVTVGLFNNSASGGHAAGDQLFAIENLIGSDFDDTFSGTGGRNVFIGGAGADQIFGGGSVDTMSYAGSDAGVSVSLFNNTASGGHATGDQLFSIENLTGSDFADVLSGDANANTFEGGAGADQIFGGFSADTASYAGSDAGVSVALFNNTASGGHAAGDQLFSIENLTGSDFDDVLSGTGGRNLLIGGDGDDQIFGGGRGDTIDGGAGNDTLAGGSGPDQFVFGEGSGQDNVLDFEDGTDLVQLTGGLTFADLTVTTVAAGEQVALTSDPTTFIVLEGLNPGDVTAADFV